jgi:hypothetical protein
VSEYGPALFVSRKDRAALPEDERAAVLRHVRAACRRVRLTDGEGRRAEPELYDYDGYEPGALGILLHSSFLYGEMPEELQADEEAGWEKDGARVAAAVEQHVPGVYQFVCYGVES